MYYKKEIGNNGEDAAFYHLINHGYSIINRNFTCKLGEIDIIGLEQTKYGPELVFFEVKTRSDGQYGTPAEAVNSYKIRHIIRVAEYFLMINNLENANCRFDIIEVLPSGKNTFRINHIKDAFSNSIN